MDSPAALPPEISQAITRGWTILTANQRAARTLRRTFDLQQRSLGHSNWEPPAILAWDTWLTSLWHRLLLEGHASALLLSPIQEHTLWRAIIRTDATTATLHPADALAETAAAAWQLLHAHNGRRRLSQYPGNSDTQTFEGWVRKFESQCKRSDYLTQAQLPEILRTAIVAGQDTSPPGLLLVGFDTKTPAQTALLESIQASDTIIEEYSLEAPISPTQSQHTSVLYDLHPPSEYDELNTCAHWLRTQLIAQPSARLAVIVPALEASRAQIDRVFRQMLAPEFNHLATPIHSSPWEFSLGVPLASTPMVATAFDLLRWTTRALPIERISALLLSPHFAADAHATEHLARAEFDAFVLRDQHLLQPQLSLAALHRLASKEKHSDTLPVLVEHLRALLPLFTNKALASEERTHAEWASTIQQLLQAAGWAVPSYLNSTEFQTLRKWESALDELTTLDFDNLRVRFAAALDSLERIAAQTLFAPESRHTPVQIMGPLESAGSTFDAIWFLHADSSSWPSKASTNPLLPWSLQRDLGMPGADHTRDAALAQCITQRIAASAPTVIFSYAHHSSEGPQRPSPALAGLPLASLHIELDPPPLPIELEAVADDTPIPAPPDRVLQGGAGILKSQAACAFRAFAEKRLFSSSLDSTSLGLDAGERGSIVHAVLENFWATVKTQAALLQLSPIQRDTQLAHSIDAALTAQHVAIEPGWPRAYVEAERQRLHNLLSPWLDYEANKRPPFAVESREQKLSDVSIGPLRIDVRVDRIDTALIGGEPSGAIILDYKTGNSKPSDWLGPRPDEPQLPLYAVVSGVSHLSGIAFAAIRPGEKNMGLKGYADADGILPKPSKLQTVSLDAQRAEWHVTLTTLAQDFHSGDARVAPKQYPATCKHCEQRLLCRLDPASLDADALDEPDLDNSSEEANRG